MRMIRGRRRGREICELLEVGVGAYIPSLRDRSDSQCVFPELNQKHLCLWQARTNSVICTVLAEQILLCSEELCLIFV